MFPGQGAYLPGVLAERVRHFPRAVEVLETIDQVAAERGFEPVSPLLLERDAIALEDLLAKNSDLLDLAIYATDAAAHEILTAVGVRADVLVGHSFGEFAALSAAGVVSVADVARMACTRTDAFHRAEPTDGGLLALDMAAWRVEHLVGILDDPGLRLAIDDGPGQTVLSGPAASLRAVEQLSAGLGFRATRLRARYAFHNPLLHGAADVFRASTADGRRATERTADGGLLPGPGPVRAHGRRRPRGDRPEHGVPGALLRRAAGPVPYGHPGVRRGRRPPGADRHRPGLAAARRPRAAPPAQPG
ncbi:acyltransferase domain-containing protein [Streptomyces sp. NPDC005876]|uniref:ACP S-malonyltransferase n=1 Tax=Streptomyces sp. NPDC005876 TaxID=3157076 RepID=UPI0033FD6731